MKNVFTILRRELTAYYTSPIGYIFMIVFLVISVGLYITSFFTYPVADMRGFFGNLPLLLCVFIPAVTMRIWAEERKENTWEMLLTFPMRARDLVLGKFTAALIFFALTLASTVTVPVMLALLGNPDNGALFSGYLGTLLLGGLFLSMGIFFSGLCKDQIVAFVVTLLACFAVFLLGTTFIASHIDNALPGVGSLLMELVGVIDHYNAFSRGVIEVADVVYFLAWTIIFLLLNVLFLEGRGRPGARVTFSTAVGLCLGIGLMFNWLLSGESLYRMDLTEDKIYTVSDATERILATLAAPVQVKLYITAQSKMPTGYKNLEQDILDKLAELRIAADNKLEIEVLHPEAANVLAQEPVTGLDEEGEEPKEEEDVLEKRMLDKGVTPFAVGALEADQMSTQYIYSSVTVGYRDKKEEVIPRIVDENLQDLEYRLVNTVYKLTREKPPKVALYAPLDSVPPEMMQLYMQMGQPVPPPRDSFEALQVLLEAEKFEFERVQLTKDSPLPEEYDALVLINPRQLNERQKWEINRALVSGKPVVLAVQQYEWNYQMDRNRLNVSKQEQMPQIEDLLEKYGLGVSKDILMDTNKFPLTISDPSNPLASLLGAGTRVDLPTQILVNAEESADGSTSLTDRLGTLLYLWGTAIELDEEQLKKHNLEAHTLLNSSKEAWTVPPDSKLTFEEPSSGKRAYPLMAMVTGQFPDAYKDQTRPVWPPAQPQPGMPPMPEEPETGEAPAITPKPGKLILMGCSQMFRNEFIQQGSGIDLFLNAVDAVALTEDLIEVRGRKPIDRAIDKPSDTQRTVWKLANYALMPVTIAVIGIAVALARRSSRNAYTMRYASGDRAS